MVIKLENEDFEFGRLVRNLDFDLDVPMEPGWYMLVANESWDLAGTFEGDDPWR